MKIKRLIGLLVLVIVVLFAVFVLTGVRSVGAALGNSGVPVSCFHSGNLSSPTNRTLTCQAADGTAFIGGQVVPTGYYLMVTDVLISCKT